MLQQKKLGANFMKDCPHNQGQHKREQFRKQIRRKHIEHIFSMKRKLVDQVNTQPSKDQSMTQQDLFQLFQGVKSRLNLEEKLTRLGNYLWHDESLSLTKDKYGTQKMHQACLKIVNNIFFCVLPTLTLDCQEHQNNRKKCLTIVSNIMADSLAPHSLLLPIVSQGLNHNYSSLAQTNSEQASEIGWIVANSICHKINLSVESDLQKPLEQLLTIAQEVILIPNLEMIGVIYKNLRVFFNNVDQFFKGENSIIQHFKVHRLILLQNTVNFNLSIDIGTKLLPVINFIECNIKYTGSISQKFNNEICKKCINILSVTSSDKIMLSAFGIIKQLLNDRQIIINIITHSFDTILKCLMYLGVNIKISVLRLLLYMCVDEEITMFMAVNKQLEDVLVDMLRSVRDADAILQMMVLVRAIAFQTERKCGMKAIAVIEEKFVHRGGQIGKCATQIVNQFVVQGQSNTNSNML